MALFPFMDPVVFSRVQMCFFLVKSVMWLVIESAVRFGLKERVMTVGSLNKTVTQ